MFDSKIYLNQVTIFCQKQILLAFDLQINTTTLDLDIVHLQGCSVGKLQYVKQVPAVNQISLSVLSRNICDVEKQ